MTTYRKLLKNRNGDTIIPVVDLMEDYSMSEVNTGRKWVDGKYIYKRTYYFPQLPNNGQLFRNIGFTNLDSVVKIEGIAQSSVVAVPVCYVSGGASPEIQTPYNIDIAYLFSSNSLRIVTGTDRTALHAYITMYYTKI